MQLEQTNSCLADIDAARGFDAVIETVVDTLPRRNHWCVEFGAWDGIWGSNSRNLILKHDYAAVLIEGNQDKFRALHKNYAGHRQVVTVNQYVGFDARDGLDAILARTSIPRDFDFLSIDIDGNDYHIWNAVVKYRPKAVCIEFNPTIPPEVSFVQPADRSVNQGSSLAALVELGKKKHYELIAVIGVNAFFVVQEHYPLFKITNNRIEALWLNRDNVTYIFSGYDGRVFLRGCQKLPWHAIPLLESKVQQVPGYLRKYPYPRWGRITYLCFTNPLSLIPQMTQWIRRYTQQWKGTR